MDVADQLLTDDRRRLLAGIVAALGAATAIPLPLAQLDFAGVIDVFGIDHGDTPAGLLVLAGVGGVLTAGVVLLALVARASPRPVRPPRARPHSPPSRAS